MNLVDGAVDCSDPGTPECCPDQDDDGVCDDDDVCPADSNDDTDGDGFCDSQDVCASIELSGNDGWLESPANPFANVDLVEGTAIVWFRGSNDDMSVFSGEGWIELAIDSGLAEGCSDGQCNNAVSALPVNDGRWHQLAVTWDASSTVLYVDGVQQESITPANTPLVDNTNRSFVLGKHASPTVTTTLDGQIAEAALWNVALTPFDILAHRDGESVVTPQLLWWRLEEGEGATSLDSSGNDHVGTLTNGAVWSGTCPRADADGDGREAWNDPDDNDPGQ